MNTAAWPVLPWPKFVCTVFGANFSSWLSSVIPRARIASSSSTVMAAGTSTSVSSRRRAVTTTSSIVDASAPVAIGSANAGTLHAHAAKAQATAEGAMGGTLNLATIVSRHPKGAAV